jgi:hypothetical protein
LYRFVGDEAKFDAWQAFSADERGELVIELDPSLADDGSGLTRYDFVVLGEQSGQADASHSAVNVIQADKTESLQVLSNSGTQLRDAPCQDCPVLRELRPGTTLAVVRHSTLGVSSVGGQQSLPSVWWFVQTEDGLNGWVWDGYREFKRNTAPAPFKVGRPPPPEIPLELFGTSPSSTTLPFDVFAELQYDLVDAFPPHCNAGDRGLRAFVQTEDLVDEPGALIDAVSCGWANDEKVTATFTFPDGSSTLDQQTLLLSGEARFSHQTTISDAPGVYEIAFHGIHGTITTSLKLVPIAGGRSSYSPGAGTGVESLYGFTANEKVRVLVYIVDGQHYRLAAWQGFRVSSSGQLYVILPSWVEAQSFKVIIVGDVSGESKGLFPHFGAKITDVREVIADTGSDRLIARIRPGGGYAESGRFTSGTHLQVLGTSSLSDGEKWWPVLVDEKHYGWVRDKYVQRVSGEAAPH